VQQVQGETEGGDMAALLAAAGQGVRLGGRPKAFLRHNGRTLLEHAVSYLLGSCHRVVAGLPEDRIDDARRLVAKRDVLCLPGGDSKQQTVARLIGHATEPFVLVHDVSEFGADPALPGRLREAIGDAAAAVPVERVRQRGAMALIGEAGEMTGVLDRDRVVASYTPQLYRREALADALARGVAEGWRKPGIYALVHRAGGRVRMVEGGPDRIKITYPEDLAVLGGS